MGSNPTLSVFRWFVRVPYSQEILKKTFHLIDLQQMGHKPQGKVRQVYDKAMYLCERIVFMNRWGDLLLEEGLVI